MAGPNVVRAAATAKGGHVRVGFTFPIGASGEWGWSCTASPELAEKLAEDLKAAAKAAREEQAKETRAVDASSGG